MNSRYVVATKEFHIRSKFINVVSAKNYFIKEENSIIMFSNEEVGELLSPFWEELIRKFSIWRLSLLNIRGERNCEDYSGKFLHVW